MAIPAGIFYTILYRNAVNLPIFDDYANILDFSNKLLQLHGVFNRIFLVLTYQHNEYKLIFENTVVTSQYFLLGHISLLPLVALGNTFALLIFLVVCCMFFRPQDDVAAKFMLLVPAAYLIFQLQYASALEWASSSLQHLAVVFFSLLSIHLISKASRASFVWASIALVFAIASSPNGFFVVPVGVLILWQNKHWQRMYAWFAMAIAMLVLYFWHYNFHSSQTSPHGSVLADIFRLNALYVFSFLGSSVARYQSIVPAVVFGMALLGLFLLATWRKYYKQNPSVYYSMLFILITAVGVSGLRSGFGLAQSLASRYRMYSNLMMVFCYFFLVEHLLEAVKKKSVRAAIPRVAFAFAVAFWVLSTLAGARFLRNKKLLLVQNMERWQTSSQQSLPSDAGIDPNSVLARQIDAGVYQPQADILRESMRLGIYRPPAEH